MAPFRVKTTLQNILRQSWLGRPGTRVEHPQVAPRVYLITPSHVSSGSIIYRPQYLVITEACNR